MTTMIDTREELDALDNGTEFRDVDGYYLLKNRDGDYECIDPAGIPVNTFGADEIAGTYDDDGVSRFFPVTIIGHCWYCDRETGRTMYDETGEDWSCSAIHDDPR